MSNGLNALVQASEYHENNNDQRTRENSEQIDWGSVISSFNYYPKLTPPTPFVRIPVEIVRFYICYRQELEEEVRNFEAGNKSLNVPLPLYCEVPGERFKLILWYVAD